MRELRVVAVFGPAAVATACSVIADLTRHLATGLLLVCIALALIVDGVRRLRKGSSSPSRSRTNSPPTRSGAVRLRDTRHLGSREYERLTGSGELPGPAFYYNHHDSRADGDLERWKQEVAAPWLSTLESALELRQMRLVGTYRWWNGHVDNGWSDCYVVAQLVDDQGSGV